jgi:hypothetical protein
MSQDIKKVLVKDDRLNVSDQISYAVNKGGQNMTSAQFNAISQSASSHTYNIQVPSEQTIIDRKVMWQSTVMIKVSSTVGNGANQRPPGTMPIQYGLTDALAPWPLHSLLSVQTATINNNSVSVNMIDVLPALLRFIDKRELQRLNGTSPVQFDTYQNYQDGIGSNNNSLGGWSLTADNDLSPRGSWVLNSISASATALVPVLQTTTDVYISFSVSEPLLLSPFIYGNPKSNNQGFYGIQNMNFVFTMNSGSRVWRSSNNWGQSVSVVNFTNSRLVFNFLTPHPSDLMESRNVVPFYELPRYITGNLPSFPAYVATSPSPQVVRTSTIQLNQVPDKLIIFVRKALSSQTMNDTDSFLTIQNISLNFNNSSGILASATQQDLYRYSVENGSNQSFLEFSGLANKFNSATGQGTVLPTSGSVLILEFGKDIQLVEDFYSSGSLGNFNLQMNLTVLNQAAVPITNTEIVVITMNSGIFVCNRGTCATYTGILTKSDVMDASSQEAYSKSDVKRMVGGGFLDTLKSVAGKVLPKLPGLAKAGLSMVNNPYAQKGADVLGALGAGHSGGGSSGGGGSGGRRRLEHRVE